ncbi:MAG: DUF4159 domain-containing protein [Dehalococcoidales bacterium]|nr:DUF4159 domain-containing protein [Dehalococcoidales bacterium]
MEINKFQLKRVNPFQGLVIDADIWQDAHNYHRDQQRLHVLAFHDTGIVSGLEVTAGNPPDYSVNINPGIAVDPDGNIIIVPQPQHYRLQTPSDKGTIYLIIQFREIPGEPYQPPEGGQPTRILEAYRIQEREFLPSEAFVELARIEFDPSQSNIRNAKNPAGPAVNEIDLRSRKNARQITPAEKQTVSIPSPAPAPVTTSPAVKENIFIGHVVLGEAGGDMHLGGLRNVARDFSRRSGDTVIVEERIKTDRSLKKYSLLYLTGKGPFELTADQQSAMKEYLRSDGVIFGDGCSFSDGGNETRGAREFGLAFNRWAGRLDCKLEMVTRDHPILTSDCMFSEVPAGCEPAILLEGGNMICSSSDYGCAWTGGYKDKPLSREVIRSAFEIAGNIIVYALRAKSKKN